MCHEYKILQTIFLETFHTFFPDQGVKHFYWHEQETVQCAECNICSRNARVHYSNRETRRGVEGL